MNEFNDNTNLDEDADYLKSLYKKQFEEKPSFRLDIEIKQLAKQRVSSKSVEKNSSQSQYPRWQVGFASAAVLIIGVGLVTFIQREASDEIGIESDVTTTKMTPSEHLVEESEMSADREALSQKEKSKSTTVNIQEEKAISTRKPINSLNEQIGDAFPNIRSAPEPNVENISSLPQRDFAELESFQSAKPKGLVSLNKSVPLDNKGVVNCLEEPVLSLPLYWRLELTNKIRAKVAFMDDLCVSVGIDKIQYYQIKLSDTVDLSKKEKALFELVDATIENLDHSTSLISDMRMLSVITKQNISHSREWQTWWKKSASDMSLDEEGNYLIYKQLD